MKIFLFIILFVSNIQIQGQNTPNILIDKRDGKKYKTIKLGNQIWMSENLAFKSDSGTWAYENDVKNVAKYGYLYNWKAAHKVCPAGWHLPSVGEYKFLLTFIGKKDTSMYNSLIEGGDSGFSAVLSGFRYYLGKFSDQDQSTYFWTTSLYSYETAWVLLFMGNSSNAGISYDYQFAGFSVRCRKN